MNLLGFIALSGPLNFLWVGIRISVLCCGVLRLFGCLYVQNGGSVTFWGVFLLFICCVESGSVGVRAVSYSCIDCFCCRFAVFSWFGYVSTAFRTLIWPTHTISMLNFWKSPLIAICWKSVPFSNWKDWLVKPWLIHISHIFMLRMDLFFSGVCIGFLSMSDMVDSWIFLS